MDATCQLECIGEIPSTICNPILNDQMMHIGNFVFKVFITRNLHMKSYRPYYEHAFKSLSLSLKVFQR